MPLSDMEIRDINRHPEYPMLSPSVESKVRRNENGEPVISYGLSSYGYDLRLGYHFLRFDEDDTDTPFDPKGFSHSRHVENWKSISTKPGQPFVIRPHETVLAESVEYFRMPSDVFGIVVGKSTYARSGLIVNCTPIEPRWNGILTLELCNPRRRPIYLYPGEGICQVVFFRGSIPLQVYESDGKYQNQTGVTPGTV